MTSERWTLVKDILDVVEDRAPEEREKMIAARCQGDPDLRREVESLLSVETRAERLEMWANREMNVQPERIGPYKVERLLGAGGMGSVFLAVRDDDQYRKNVAIKLIQWSSDHHAARRFRAERQLLANLDHPNIVRLIDGGALPGGQPYLAMDYIDGRPIDAFVRDGRLEIGKTLILFLKVCDAVQFAHQNLIIHRDLKAANVLVTADGEPHLLDFGIAKLLDPEGSQRDGTQPWQRILTPASASPEQALGGPVTTASDVYSLGVMLYLLVTGVPFYSGSRDFTADPARSIREYEPPAASDTPGLAPRVRRQLAGDLDTIVRKATAKDVSRRYATAEEFAADIRRHIDGHPVKARPAALSYRLGKFVRRNRVLVSAAILVLLAIGAGTAASAVYSYRARQAQQLAERRLEELHRLTNSMLFEVDDVLVTLQGATAARAAIVNRTLQYLDRMSSDAGNSQAVLRDMASAYTRVGRIQAAEKTAHLGGPGSLRNGRRSFEKAAAIRQRLADAEPNNMVLQIELLNASWDIGGGYADEGDLDKTISIYTASAAKCEALAQRARNDEKNFTEIEYNLGSFLTGVGALLDMEGNFPGALAYLRRGAAVRVALAAAHPGDRRAMRVLGIAHNYLATGLAAAGRPGDAAAEERQALAVWEPMAAESPRNVELRGMVADANESLCRDLAHEARYPEASPHCREAVAQFSSVADEDPNNVQAKEDLATAFSAMSDLLDSSGRPGPAIEWENKARTLYTMLAAKDPDSLENATNDASSLLHLGSMESRAGKRAAGARDLRESRDMLERQMKQSPKNYQIATLYRQASAALDSAK